MAVRSIFSAEVETKSYVYAMRMIGKDVLPSAIADTLNGVAEANVKPMQANVKKMNIRTPFTLKSIKQLRFARGRAIDRMFSQVGSLSSYLWMHDEGLTKTGVDGGPIPIAWDMARSRKSAMGIIRKVYRIDKNEKFRPGDFGTQAGYARYFIGTPKGSAKGKPRREGVYERGYNNKRLHMLRNLETDKATLKRTNWFTNPLKKYGTAQFIKAIFIKQAQRRLRRAGVE